MRKCNGVLVLLVILMLAVPSLADAQWYLGGGFGFTDADLSEPNDLPPDEETEDSDTAFKIFGGYDFSETFAVEASLGTLGEYKGEDGVETAKIDASALGITLVGRTKVHDNWDFFGKVGLAVWSAELKYSDPTYAPFGVPIGFSSSGDDTGLDPLIGLGFEYHVNEQLGIRIEWEQFQNVGDEVKTDLPPGTGYDLELNGSDINVFGLGVAYRF